MLWRKYDLDEYAKKDLRTIVLPDHNGNQVVARVVNQYYILWKTCDEN